MKKILFIMIMAATLVACNNKNTSKAYLDANGDCIFENSVVAYRINGASNPVITNGMEAVLKAVIDKKEVVKDRKAAVAASMNDGGSAILLNDSLIFPQANFESFEVVEQTPDYVVFTLTYPAWQVGEDNISLVRTITLRNRSIYCEVKDVYKCDEGAKDVTVAAGFAKRNVANSEKGADYLVAWENIGADEAYGVGIVMPMSSKFEFDGPADHAVAIYPTKYGRPVEYAIGSCWSKGELSTFDSWAEKVRL